jgi:hypothetical protein
MVGTYAGVDDESGDAGTGVIEVVQGIQRPIRLVNAVQAPCGAAFDLRQ